MEQAECPTICVVDDDPSVRRGLARLFHTQGFNVDTFASAQEFLARQPQDHLGCLVLDVSMPGLSGTDLQSELAARNIHIPIVFLTGQGDIPMSVQAMKSGAVDFLVKPVNREALLTAVQQALQKGHQDRIQQAKVDAVQRKVQTLTPREQEVMKLVVKGLLNKQIAPQLGIGEKTVKVHRARVMQKMEVTSLADLVREASIASPQQLPSEAASE
jgi:FixJ family two-component response regulator